MLVHGAMDRGTSFRRVSDHLEDFEVVTYDRRGYGRSDDLSPSEDFGVQVDDLMSVVDGRRAVLAGHSLGGNIVLAAAARDRGLVAAAVAYEPPPSWQRAGRDSSGAPAIVSAEDEAEAFFRRMVGERIWQGLPASTQARRRAEGPVLRAEMAALRKGVPFDPAKIDVPVLLAYGSKGLERSAAWLVELFGLIDQASLVVVPGAPHGLHLSSPETFASLIRAAADFGPGASA